MDSICTRFINELVDCHSMFNDVVRTVNEDWYPDAPPVTILFAALGRGLGEMISVPSEAQLQEIFSLVETGFVSGSPELKAAIGTGFLEAFSSCVNGRNSFDKRLFSILGSESARHVKAWLGE